MHTEAAKLQLRGFSRFILLPYDVELSKFKMKWYRSNVYHMPKWRALSTGHLIWVILAGRVIWEIPQ